MKKALLKDERIVRFVSELWNRNYEISEIAQELGQDTDIEDLITFIQHWRSSYGEGMFPYRVKYD